MFKEWFRLTELAHIAHHGQQGEYLPIPILGKNAIAIDMKFERYPEPELKKELSAYGAKFYGQIPGDNKILVFDGRDADTAPVSAARHFQNGGYIELPSYWWKYAQIQFEDGSMKEPQA